MKITGVAMMMTMLGPVAWAREIPAARVPLTVCFGGTNDIALENRAMAVASRVFAQIGVRVDWRRGLHNCPRQAIQIDLSENTPASQRPEALAYALPYEGTHIVVFLDRVRNTVGPHTVPYLLGHVLAHEVAHILEGVAAHSERGLMKARWDGEDYEQMAWAPLAFTDADVQLINLGLEARAARLAPGPMTAANVQPAAGQ
jgi:hypothetical protein